MTENRDTPRLVDPIDGFLGIAYVRTLVDAQCQDILTAVTTGEFDGTEYFTC
jgi:hypothetical protein